MINGKYEAGLLWRYDDIQMPERFGMAMGRLKCLDKKIAKNIIYDIIRSDVRDHIQKGLRTQTNIR